MSNGIFTGTIIQGKDGSLNFEMQSLRVKASKRFTPAQLLPLRDWLNSASETWEVVPERKRSQAISYSHEEGKLRLETAGGVKYYDPNSDEDLARLVRHLKSRAPIPRGEPVQPSFLPEVTAEDLRTKRQVFKEAMPAAGAKKPKRARAGQVSLKPSTSDLEASQKLDAILMGMF